MHLRSWALCLLALTVVEQRAALAQTESPPARIGLVGGVRQNLGELGDIYGSGWLLGVEAGYQPSWIPVGFMWSVMFGQFYSDEPSVVDPDLSIVEMSFGLHARRSISQTSVRYLFAGAGVTLLRSENSLPPDGERTFLGPYVGAGVEQYLFGRYLLSLGVRYGLLYGGPAGVGLNLSLNVGNF